MSLAFPRGQTAKKAVYQMSGLLDNVTRHLVITLFASGLFAACAAQEEPIPVDPVAQASTSGPLSRRLALEFDKHYKQAQGTSYAALQQRYQRDYLGAPKFNVSDADHYKAFVSAFKLNAKATQKLDKLGFVVVPSPSTSGKGPADVYYRVFAQDLPVFISADSILHAWHRSFDKILEQTEELDLHGILTQLTTKTMGALDATKQADRDALFYLAVARALLDGSAPPPSVASEVNTYLGLIKNRGLAKVDFLGVKTDIDFSQFIPRGHYTNSEKLKKYFMSMMWLGRTDLVLHDPDPAAEPRPREEAAARALAGAMQRSGALPFFKRLDSYYAAFVGRTNALTPEALLGLCAKANLTGCVGKPAAMTAHYAKQPAPEYSSRVFAGDVPPITMRFFPQRFAYGAWITSQTTTPRLKPAVPGGRAMAMPEDVAFALGSDRAVKYFAQDMARPLRQNLPATLQALRQTMDAIKPTALDDTIFNNWLEGLQALSKPGLEAALPQTMRTAAWHDRKLEAVLASWTELRHDTILIVEQSTGGVGCQYPKGYVEPVPGLYTSLDRAAELLAQVYAGGNFTIKKVPEVMAHWRETLKRLGEIAGKELAGKPMSDEELAWLNKTADMHGTSYYGKRMFDGWYPQLYWTRTWEQNPSGQSSMASFGDHPSGISEPIVADVHTDAESGLALEVATGHPGLMIVAVDNGGDVSLYGGPVSSYYSFHVNVSERMTDEQWEAQLDAGKQPARPDFAKGYWAD